jgi:hypothetical protein
MAFPLLDNNVLMIVTRLFVTDDTPWMILHGGDAGYILKQGWLTQGRPLLHEFELTGLC